MGEAETIRLAVPVNERDHVMGPTNAPVTVVTYPDERPKFWEMNRLLYLHPGKLEDQELRQYAKEAGLDLERFDREMAGGVYAEPILRDQYFSLTQGITGTPTTFINGVRYAMSRVELVRAVKAVVEGQGVKEQWLAR